MIVKVTRKCFFPKSLKRIDDKKIIRNYFFTKYEKNQFLEELVNFCFSTIYQWRDFNRKFFDQNLEHQINEFNANEKNSQDSKSSNKKRHGFWFHKIGH